MDNKSAEKFFIILHDLLIAATVLLWLAMMLRPSYVRASRAFGIINIVYVLCAVIYSVMRKKYFPLKRCSKTEKIIIAVMITLLVIKLIFF